MKKTNLLLTIVLSLAVYGLAAQSADSPAIRRTEYSPNVIDIRNDTIFLARSTTYIFTVDTPEDEGLTDTSLTAEKLGEQLEYHNGEQLTYRTTDRRRQRKLYGRLVSGDNIEVRNGPEAKMYKVAVQEAALSPVLSVHSPQATVGTPGRICLDFTAGQRSPRAEVRFYIPAGVEVTLDNTTVDVIGRGEVTLRELPRQSIGRTGTNYSYGQVGHVSIEAARDGGQVVKFSGLDLRPLNGIDLRLRIDHPGFSRKGEYVFTADYTTAEPEVYRSEITPLSTATVNVVNTVADFRREMPVMFTLAETPDLYLSPELKWSVPQGAKKISLQASADGGKTWNDVEGIKPKNGTVKPKNLRPDTYYRFRLEVEGGPHAGLSNEAEHYTGKIDVRSLGVKGDGSTDDTEALNNAILKINKMGGGVLTFPAGDYPVRTVHLKSNVWLHVDRDAVVRCLRNTDAPEPTWFSDKAYRSGLSPTDPSPYNPENWLTKQDVGHTFFRNTMFFAERERNIKIFGTGRITGDGNLVNSDGVMNNDPGNRADKMFTFKLCTQIEIGGYDIGKDMWYCPDADEPYYIGKGAAKEFELENVLHIDRGGHFVLLATGTDTLNVHDTYFGKVRGNARDIYDFMACSKVAATNIYSKMSSDDIIKLGSDCSLGFTRPVGDYIVRNIIGDTNCNLFQIGSETADDIQDVYVDNIYILGSNKAGFSISTNDGAHVKNVYLNSGKTGKIHSRSKMYRSRAPFFISISNRGRVLGADVKRFRFTEDDRVRDELLVTNSPIGRVENIVIRDIDIYEVYGGSSHGGTRWKPYDGSQNKATPIIAGYRLPDTKNVEGGLGFTLPDGRHTGYIDGIEFHGVNLLVKGGHPAEDAFASPPEIGVGRYNVSDLRIQPSYGFWFRHAKNVVVKDCSIDCETPDGRHAIVLNNVEGAKIEKVKMPSYGAQPLIKTIDSRAITIK